jgi:hypothetical protein
MQRLIEKGDIDNLISIQKSAIRLHAFFAFGIFIFGIMLFVLGYIAPTNEVVKSIINIGGAFISTLCTSILLHFFYHHISLLNANKVRYKKKRRKLWIPSFLQ